MEHRRVRRVTVLAVGLAGDDDADRRLRFHGAHLHRRGVRAAPCARVHPGLKKKVSCISAGWPSGEVQRREIVMASVSTSGPSAIEKPAVGEDRGDLSAIPAIGWTGCSAGERTERRDVRRAAINAPWPRVDAAFLRSALRAFDRLISTVFKRVDLGAARLSSSGVIEPSVFRSSETDPSCQTRRAASIARHRRRPRSGQELLSRLQVRSSFLPSGRPVFEDTSRKHASDNWSPR